MSERNVKGLLGTKLGMTQVWDADNKVVPVTVIQAGPCVVTQVRTPDADGYSAVQLGFGAVKAKNVTKPASGHFERAGVTPRKHLVELRTADASTYTLGQELTAETFGESTAGTIGDIEVPPTKRAITVQVDQVTGVGTTIKPGDYVDMVVGIRADKFPVITTNPADNSFTVVAGINGTSVKLLLQGMQVLGTLLPPPRDR